MARPADKQALILRVLRRNIVSGRLAPGNRMPSRVELETEFAAGRETVQRALDRLTADGFVRSDGRRGTFVSRRPPHLHHFGVVELISLDPRKRSQFVELLSRQATSLAGETPKRQMTVYRVQSARDEDAGFRRAMDDLTAMRFAGLVFLTSPHILAGTPLLDAPNLPRVAIQSAPSVDPNHPSVLAISTDSTMLIDRAVEALVKDGRRRLAILSNMDNVRSQNQFRRACEDNGAITRPWWIQMANPFSRHNAEQLVTLMFHPDQRERPDGLLIVDDHLVESTTRGLAAMKIDCRGDLTVIAHCNFPQTPRAHVPVRFIGFDSRQIARLCFQTLDSLRSGAAAPLLQRVPALFEEEIISSNHGSRQAQRRRAPANDTRLQKC